MNGPLSVIMAEVTVKVFHNRGDIAFQSAAQSVQMRMHWRASEMPLGETILPIYCRANLAQISANWPQS
jgi:hypothetical protein